MIPQAPYEQMVERAICCSAGPVVHQGGVFRQSKCHTQPYKDMAICLETGYDRQMANARFEWGAAKDHENWRKHGVDFTTAQSAFFDSRRVIAEDRSHSQDEDRYYCLGAVGSAVLTVRFTYRAGVIRIIGAGYWRKGKQIYERENKIYR